MRFGGSASIAEARRCFVAPSRIRRPSTVASIGIESPPVIDHRSTMRVDWARPVSARPAGAIVLLALAGVSLKGRMHVRSVS